MSSHYDCVDHCSGMLGHFAFGNLWCNRDLIRGKGFTSKIPNKRVESSQAGVHLTDYQGTQDPDEARDRGIGNRKVLEKADRKDHEIQLDETMGTFQ